MSTDESIFAFILRFINIEQQIEISEILLIFWLLTYVLITVLNLDTDGCAMSPLMYSMNRRMLSTQP